MKNRISKILGLGVTAGLVFSLIGAVSAAPVAADEMKWTTVNTPSWADHVIEPGSDIFDYAVGPDGDTIYAIGAVNTLVQPSASITGISGSFAFTSGTVTITVISSSVAAVSGTLYGDACYLNGDFTVIAGDPFTGGVSITGIVTGGEAVLTGYIDGDPDPGQYAGTVDTMTFSGQIYGSISGSGTTTTSLIAPATICVSDEFFGGFTSGVVTFTNNSLYAEPRVWKSTDGGVTWDDITGIVQAAASLPGPFTALTNYSAVSVAPDDEDWVVIAGQMYNRNLNKGTGPGNVGYDSPGVVASKDGGDNFSYAGDMVDASHSTWMGTIFDMDVAPETDSIHNIAVAGEIGGTWTGAVYRLKAGTWLSGAWEDTTFYAGWDSGVVGTTRGVNTVAFSTNFDVDDTIVCLGVNNLTAGNPYLQSGIWETAGTWNDSASFAKAVEITSDGEKLLLCSEARNMGLALPADYDGSDPGARVVFLFIDAYNTVTHQVGGYVFRVDDSAITPTCGPAGDPLLASIAVHGDADTGKIMIGEYTQWDNDADEAVPFECCKGVRVWHTEELDFCCPSWDLACKNPSGPYMALVAYTPDGTKAYAATRGTVPAARGTYSWSAAEHRGGLSDESAFSVSRDDGVSFNQIGLIDTDIDYLSDVAVCPDCGTIYLSTINISDCTTCTACTDMQICEVCESACDSVWRSYDDGDTWERVNHGDWSESPANALLLRLPCDAIEDCCDQDPVSPSGTIYLAVKGTKSMFYSRDCGQCWNTPPAAKIFIQDFAVESENIVYVLDTAGYVSKSTQYGRRWSDKVDTTVKSGHSITSCCEQGFVVVGGDGTTPNKVGWSDDGGDTWNLTDALPKSPTLASGYVHVACDPVCENIIYAAVDGDGIFRCDITDGAWTDLTAMAYGYTGIVMAREGTLYASTDEITVDIAPAATATGIDCMGRKLVAASLAGTASNYYSYSGVARNLGPCETACCGTEDWDYLICGLSGTTASSPYENFDSEPSALRICGCLTAATNSILWAIDTDAYDVQNGSASLPTYGQLWSYEDCAAKLGPVLTSPEDGAVLDCEPCAGCDAANFTLKWERPCLACSYDIEIMDEDGNVIVSWVDEDITGSPPTLFVDGSLDSGYYYLECGETFSWHVRMANTDCECVHSPWSDTWSFTIAVGAADAINLLAPVKGALDIPINNIGFSWTAVRNATSYSFVLSPNANLTGALVSQDMSTTAFNYVGPLDYSKAYYWQIVAWQDSTRLTTSSIGVFNTMAEPVAPTPPVEVTTTPAPVINIPPAEQITPTWIYAIIGIGAALAVVVIVLIVRTRRP
jgi:hypothetical protein